MGEKTRYSDGELEEFKQIILNKLDKAKKDYELLKEAITHGESNDTQDTSPTFKVLEEGAATLSKEEAGKLKNGEERLKGLVRKIAKQNDLKACRNIRKLKQLLKVIRLLQNREKA